MPNSVHFRAPFIIISYTTNTHTKTQGFKNTLIYTQLLPFQENDQFVCKVAENTKEACQLIEDGWEYVTGEYGDGGKIFRKPK